MSAKNSGGGIGIDPSAQIDVSLLSGLVSVDSETEVAAFCATIEAHGLIAEPTTRVTTRTPQLLSPDEAPAATAGTMASLSPLGCSVRSRRGPASRPFALST
jgi:hypothetical protein